MLRPEVAIARKLRRQMSYPEVLLWQRLRCQATGFKFRKQHPIGPYVVDFCCIWSKLVVEVDGAIHDGDRALRDDARSKFLRENGFQVLRVRAIDVAADIDAVVTAIVSLAEHPLHHASHGPPPRAGEDI
jgi:very-short-patch-repair endonuclease